MCKELVVWLSRNWWWDWVYLLGREKSSLRLSNVWVYVWDFVLVWVFDFDMFETLILYESENFSYVKSVLIFFLNYKKYFNIMCKFDCIITLGMCGHICHF